MRPTVWVEYAKYFEDDPAIRIKNYFDEGAVLKSKFMNQPSDEVFVMPYFLRMNLSEILLNRYNCWNYFSNYIGHYLLWLLAVDQFKKFIVNNYKPHISNSLWVCLKKLNPL